MTAAFWVQSLIQIRVGLLGMRRRIVDYDPALGIEGGSLLSPSRALSSPSRYSSPCTI